MLSEKRARVRPIIETVDELGFAAGMGRNGSPSQGWEDELAKRADSSLITPGLTWRLGEIEFWAKNDQSRPRDCNVKPTTIWPKD